MEKLVIISFDIPLSKASFRVKIWRRLKELGAEKRMRSHWVLPLSKRNLIELMAIAREIKKTRGKVEIIVGRKVM
jgi:hypothetical protein